MKRLTLLHLLCTVLCVLPWAAQGLTLGEGDRTGVTVAQNAMNQLRVMNDRIQTLRGIPAEVLVTLDPVLGDAYFTVNTTKPFTVFVTTEQKRRMVLDCLPLKDIPATVIVIEAPVFNPTTPPPSIQQNDVMAFVRELREKVNTLSSKKRPFMAQESPIRQRARRVLLMEKHEGTLLGRVYGVRSLTDVNEDATHPIVARVVSPASRGLHPMLYVVEVIYA